MGFYALSMASLFALIAPAVLLYFLKLKRPRQQVPSLVLWRQVLADHRVNSPFQKFKRNILLLLQLLLLCLLILGAMQPYIRAGDADLDRLLILLDRSASMGALDKEGGASRLDAARAKIKEMVEQMSFDQEFSVIAFGSSARQVVPFTSNKRLLIEALDQVGVEDVASDLSDALRMAEAAYRTTSISRVLLLTDGNVPPKVDFDLPFKNFQLQKVEPAGANLGITALSARRSPGEGWKVFVKVEGTKEANIPATLELLQDSHPIAEERLVLGEGGERRFVFPIQTQSRTSLELRLKTESFDSLAADNAAFLELAPARPLTVYVSPSLESFAHALKAIKGLTVYPDGDSPPPARVDLMVTAHDDQPATESPTRLHIGSVPSELAGVVEVVKGQASVVDWRRASPLLEHVEMNDLALLEHTQWVEGANEENLENLRFEALVHGPKGPLVLQRIAPGRSDYYMLFHTDRSTLPFRVGFPILVSNLVRMAMQEAGLLEVHGERAGALPVLRLSPGGRYTVHGPEGYERSEAADDKGVLSGLPAPRVGRYTVRESGEEKGWAGLSLLQRDESLMLLIDELQLAELKVAAAQVEVKTNRSLWLPLTWLALAMLAVEWWFYQRRPGGVA